MSASPKKPKDERHSLTVMILTLASRLLGIVKAKVIGSVYGSGMVGDVINFTYNIPNNFRKLFAEGAMSSAYVPVFSRLIDEERRKETNSLLNLLFTWQTVLFVMLVLMARWTGSAVIQAVSDFPKEGVLLGGSLLPFFMVFLGAISLSTITNSMLQCHQRFFAASFSPLLFSFAVIFGVWYGRTPQAMGWSVMIGGFLQLGYSIIAIHHMGYRIRFSFRPPDGTFGQVIHRWVIVIGASVIQIIGQQVSFSFASMMAEGSVTALSNATIFWQTPYGIFLTAISTVYFPLMSGSWARGDRASLTDEMGKGLEYLATFLIPSSLVIGTLSQECVSTILQSGAFTAEVALLTSRVVRAFLWGMPFIAWYGFFQKCCYSVDRYRLVLILTAIQTGIDIFCSWLFLHLGYTVVSLAIAGNIGFLVALALMMFSVRDVYAITNDTRLGKALGKILLANLPLAVLCIVYRNITPLWWGEGSTWRNFGITCALGLTGCLVVLLSYRIFRIPFLTVLKKQRSDH